MASLVRKGPLQGRAPWQGEGLRFADDPLMSLLLLRGRPDEATQRRIATLLGCQLPRAPLLIEQGKSARVLMLAPWRWMVFIDRQSSSELLRQLHETLATSLVVVSDVSDGHACIRIEGRRAIDLLAAGTAVDLHPRSFHIGHCAQNELARTRCMIWRRDETSYDLLVDASAADYVWTWLSANAEFAVAAHRLSGAD